MEEDLLAGIVTSAGVSSLVGDKVRWAVREGAPCVALHLIDLVPDRSLKGETGLLSARVQIDCWATDFLSAKALGDAVTAALPSIGAVIGATKFLSCAVLDTDRSREGDGPNVLFRTRIDVRVHFHRA